MDLLKEMVAFAYVVDCAGFTPAARALGVEPSSISRSVMRLERALGARLLARSSKAITLTEIGAKIYIECSRIVDASREVRGLAERHSTSAAGMLRVSAPVTLGQIWLAPLVAGFTERYPDVDLSITLSDVAVDLAEAQIDVALRICTAPPEETAARILFPVPYVLVASPAYLSQYGHPDHPDQLALHRCLHLGYGAFTCVWPMRKGEQRLEVAISPRFAFSNSLGIALAAETGAGIGLIPAFVASASLATGKLVPVLPDWQLEGTYRRSAYLVFAAGPNLPLKIRAFADYLLSSGAPA